MIPATKRQTWMLFCLTHKDYRKQNLSKEEASKMIRDLIEKKNKNLEQIRKIMDKAILEASKAAKAQYQKLLKEGPKWNVIDCDPLTGKEKKNPANRDKNGKQKPGWQLLDVCGFANIYIYRSQKFCNGLKKIAIEKDENWRGWKGKGWELYKNYGKGYGLSLNYLLSTRQELSIHKAAMEAAARVLKQNGVVCYVTTRID